jgi:hypothetical protein
MASSKMAITPPIPSPTTDGVATSYTASPYSFDTILNSFLCSCFRLSFKDATLDFFRGFVKEHQIVESWILVELGRNGRSEQPLALDQLFTVSNAKSAADRYLEMEFWRQEWDIKVASIIFKVALSIARKIADGETLANPGAAGGKISALELKNMDSLRYIRKAEVVPHAILFDKIQSGNMTGVWKVEKGWKIKIQTAFDLFHTQLTTSLSTLAQADSLTPSFTYFVKCHPNPYHLLNLPSQREAAAPL